MLQREIANSSVALLRVLALSFMCISEVRASGHQNIDDLAKEKRDAIVGILVHRQDNTEEKGTGFWVSDRYIITARHLVTTIHAPYCNGNTSLPPLAEIKDIEIFSGPPSDVATPNFQIPGPNESLQQRVKKPARDDDDADIAVLDLGGRAAYPRPLQMDVNHRPLNEKVVTYGFGDERVTGEASFGSIIHLSLDSTDNLWDEQFAPPLIEGFSGSPIFDQHGDVVAVHSCGRAGGEAYGTPISLARGWLEAKQIPDTPSMISVQSGEEGPRVILTGSVWIYSNSEEHRMRRSRPLEIDVQIRNHSHEILGDAETDQDGIFKVPISPIDLTKEIQIYMSYNGNPAGFVQDPSPLILDKKPVIVNNVVSVREKMILWEHKTYIGNKLQDTLADENLLKDKLGTFPCGVSIDGKCPSLSAEDYKEIKKIEAGFHKILNNSVPTPDGFDSRVQVSFQLGAFESYLSKVCNGAVAMLPVMSDPMAHTPQYSAYLKSFTTWVSTCVARPKQLHAISGTLVRIGDEARWGLNTLENTFSGHLEGVFPSNDMQIIFGDYLGLFQFYQDKGKNAGKIIEEDPKLLGMFDSFIENWVKRGCGNVNADESSEESINHLLVELARMNAARKCFQDSESFVK